MRRRRGGGGREGRAAPLFVSRRACVCCVTRALTCSGVQVASVKARFRASSAWASVPRTMASSRSSTTTGEPGAPSTKKKRGVRVEGERASPADGVLFFRRSPPNCSHRPPPAAGRPASSSSGGAAAWVEPLPWHAARSGRERDGGRERGRDGRGRAPRRARPPTRVREGGAALSLFFACFTLTPTSPPVHALTERVHTQRTHTPPTRLNSTRPPYHTHTHAARKRALNPARRRQSRPQSRSRTARTGRPGRRPPTRPPSGRPSRTSRPCPGPESGRPGRTRPPTARSACP